MPGFLKGINVAATVGVIILAVAAFCYVLYLQSRVSELQTSLATTKAELAVQVTLVEDSVDSCNDQLSKIKILELQKKAASAEIKGLADRLDILPKEPAHDQETSSFADELNGINRDANRMLERSSQ